METKGKRKRYPVWLIPLVFSIGFIIGILYFYALMPQDILSEFDKGYKAGQIDALNGIQNYDKVATKDSIYIKIK